MSGLCGVCTGCTVGAGGAVEVLRLAKACGQSVFVLYRGDGDGWAFVRYVVAGGREVAERRAGDVLPGVPWADQLVVIADEASAIMRRQES